MALLESIIEVKASSIPGVGLGLFAKRFIAKGALIVEYTGRITTWKDVAHDDGSNMYIYYVTRNHVIDARKRPKSLARYANDANGLTKIKGIKNNAAYVELNKKVFLKSARDIEAGEEILVPYGKEYWDVIRHNIKVEQAKS